MIGTVAIFVLLFCVLAPIPIWALKALGVISPRSSDYAVALVIAVAGASFLAIGWFIFKESGHILNTAESGPSTIDPEAGAFEKLVELAGILLFGCGLIYGGWRMARDASKRY